MHTKIELLKLYDEILNFRKEKRVYFKNKYPDITNKELRLKLERSVKYRYGKKQKRLIQQHINNFIKEHTTENTFINDLI